MALSDWSAFDRPATGASWRSALYSLWSAVNGLLSSTGNPPNLLMHPNRITSNVTIPDGYNAIISGKFEVSPDVTIEGQGNSTLTGI